MFNIFTIWRHVWPSGWVIDSCATGREFVVHTEQIFPTDSCSGSYLLLHVGYMFANAHMTHDLFLVCGNVFIINLVIRALNGELVKDKYNETSAAITNVDHTYCSFSSTYTDPYVRTLVYILNAFCCRSMIWHRRMATGSANLRS